VWRIRDRGHPREVRVRSSLALKSQERDFADSSETFFLRYLFINHCPAPLIYSLIIISLYYLKFVLYTVLLFLYVAALFCTMYIFF
jgi:hypothetical protein